MNWKIGQKLVYIDNGMKWSFGQGNEPKIGEIVTIYSIGIVPGTLQIIGYLTDPKGIKQHFSFNNFRPLLGQSAKSELVSSFPEVIETSDLPIRSPQPVPSSCGS